MTNEELLLAIKSTLDDAGFKKVASETKAVEGHMSALGASAMGAGKAMAAGLAVGVAAVGGLVAGAMHLDSVYGVVFDKLRTTAGATGADFDSLAQSVRNVAGNTPADIRDIGKAISEVSARTGQTGPQLEGLTKQILELSKITGTDASQNIELLTRMLGDASVPAEKSAAAIDMVYRASTTTGVGVQRLAGLMVSFGAPMRNLGFTMEQSAAMLGRFEKEGVNTELVMGALKSASARWADAGVKPIDGLTQVIAKIQELGPSAEATAIAMDTFGLKAGGDMVDTILGGKFAIEDLTKSIVEGSDTVGAAAKDIEGFDEAWLKAKNGVLLAVLPMATAVSDAIGGMVGDLMTKAQPGLDALTKGFEDAQAAGQGPFSSALAGVTAALAALGVDDAEAKVKAFGDTVKGAATFVREDLWPALLNVGSAVVNVTKFLIDHKGMVLTVVGVYAAFRTALAINKAVAAVGEALAATKAAWLAYKAGTLGATLATSSFGVALKVAMGPVGWLIIAVGLLYAAWKTNFGGIRDYTEAVVNWFKSIPIYFKGAWDKVIGDVVALVAEWKRIWLKIKEHPVQGFGDLIVFLLTLPTRLGMIGVDIIEGLLGGIKRAWAGLKRWLTGAAGAIPQAVKTSLKMQSPPPAMIEIGWWIGEAMRLGIVKSWPGVIQTADEFARAVVAKLGEATGRVDVGLRIADAARAAVAAALAADGVIQGKRESASDAWGRYYDEMTRREDELHELKMTNIEDEYKRATEANDAARAAAIEVIEREKRHFEWLKDQQAQEAAKGGAPVGPKLEDFGLEVERVQEKLRGIIDMIDGDAGNGSLADFWKLWNDDVNANITTTEDLGKAIDAILAEAGEAYDDLQKKIDAARDSSVLTEQQRHDEVMRLLAERKAFIDALIQAQADAEADLADLIAERDRLLAAARTELANAQKAAEEGENRVHAGVMAGIAAERAARTGAHKARMIQLEDERKALEAGHAAELARLQKQRDEITEGFEERERQIAHDRTALDQLKLRLGVDEAVANLAVLEQKLNDMKAVAESFQVALRGREAGEAARKAIIERTKITTDAQRQALQAALDSGTLDEKDRRRVELLLLGRGTQRLTDVKRILAAGQEVLQGQIDYQRAVVEANQTAIAAREHLIETAEKILKIDRDNAVERLAAIDAQITAENERYDNETKRLTERMTLEQQRYDAEMDFLDRMADAEDKRHEQRMTDIAAEYALELAKLGMTSAEIDALVARAQAEAARIARETEDTFKRMREEAEKAGGLAQSGGLGISKPVPITPINPGGPIGGLRPGGGAGGSLILDLSKVTAETGTIDKVELGGMTMTGTQVSVQVGGRDVAGVVVDELLGDVTLLDKLGKKLNERRATGGQIGGGP